VHGRKALPGQSAGLVGTVLPAAEVVRLITAEYADAYNRLVPLTSD
jgi:hypothetical protein